MCSWINLWCKNHIVYIIRHSLAICLPVLYWLSAVLSVCVRLLDCPLVARSLFYESAASLISHTHPLSIQQWARASESYHVTTPTVTDIPESISDHLWSHVDNRFSIGRCCTFVQLMKDLGLKYSEFQLDLIIHLLLYHSATSTSKSVLVPRL